MYVWIAGRVYFSLWLSIYAMNGHACAVDLSLSLTQQHALMPIENRVFHWSE